MKRYVFAILLLCLFTGVKAQLYVQSGATLYIGGIITLHNEDLIRSPGAGPVISYAPGSNVMFTGNADNTINGNIDFLNIEIAKEGTHQVSLLGYNGEVQRQLVFTSGLLNLNNQTLRLGNTGALMNENENSRIIGSTGGVVQTTLTLNQPTDVNPGNIGAAITSGKNLGEVVISRTYMDPYPVPSNSIKRYYSIHFTDPANDNDLDATLRLSYFDAELSGTDETRLVHWKREDASGTWMQQGPTANITRNTGEDWVQLTHTGSLSNWTLAESSGALPVEFSVFNVACADNAAVISWQTATEINTDHFEVQRSVNGADWTTIATQRAAGQSSTLQDYSYTDRAQVSSPKLFYRILSVDIDGRKKYTETKSSACGSTENWQVWPNPVQQQLYIRLTAERAYKTSMQLFDNKGTLVRQWQRSLVRGINQFTVDMQDLAAGTYHLIIIRYDNREQKSVEIIKQ
ncbi:MAG TPA: T9SS type A sorting domain-containing protein [Chryseolinea sp.]|nr:T9SS type A sorting domain-containing protein [Chryseolinea sp.]